MFDHLHSLPLIVRIQLKILTLIYRSHIGQAPRYLRDLIRLPSSAISLRPLRSLDHHDLFVRRTRTSMAQTRAFAIIGPALWNQLPPSTRSSSLTGEPTASSRSLRTQDYSLLYGSLAMEALLIGESSYPRIPLQFLQLSSLRFFDISCL